MCSLISSRTEVKEPPDHDVFLKHDEYIIPVNNAIAINIITYKIFYGTTHLLILLLASIVQLHGLFNPEEVIVRIFTK